MCAVILHDPGYGVLIHDEQIDDILMSSRADPALLSYLLSYPPDGTLQLLKEELHTVPW